MFNEFNIEFGWLPPLLLLLLSSADEHIGTVASRKISLQISKCGVLKLSIYNIYKLIITFLSKEHHVYNLLNVNTIGKIGQ